MSRGQAATWSGVGAGVSIAGGALLLSATSDCDSNSEDPAVEPCDLGDASRDFAVTVGGAALLVTGVAFLGTMIYVLAR